MKMRVMFALSFIMSLGLLMGCGGGGSGSVPTGTVSMDIADARPFVAGAQPDEVWIHPEAGGLP